MQETVTPKLIRWDRKEDLESIETEDISRLLKDLDPYAVHEPELLMLAFTWSIPSLKLSICTQGVCLKYCPKNNWKRI